MTPAIHPDGSFSARPAIGTAFRSPAGETVTIAASWQFGVVFEGGSCCTARHLVDRFTLLNKEIDHASV